jgi:hypothetical protein
VSNVSIHRLDVIKVADHYADFWEGTLDATSTLNETANAPSLGLVWTRTKADGLGADGPTKLGEMNPQSITVGDYFSSDYAWVNQTELDAASSSGERFYAMSGVLTVETAVSEPSSAI